MTTSTSICGNARQRAWQSLLRICTVAVWRLVAPILDACRPIWVCVSCGLTPIYNCLRYLSRTIASLIRASSGLDTHPHGATLHYINRASGDRASTLGPLGRLLEGAVFG